MQRTTSDAWLGAPISTNGTAAVLVRLDTLRNLNILCVNQAGLSVVGSECQRIAVGNGPRFVAHAAFHSYFSRLSYVWLQRSVG